MATGAASGAVNTWLDTWSSPWWARLHSADPGAAGTANGFTATTASARSSATIGPASQAGGTCTKAATSTATWTSWDQNGVTATHVSVWSASAAGTFYFSAALATSRALNTGDTFNLTALSASVSGLAA